MENGRYPEHDHGVCYNTPIVLSVDNDDYQGTYTKIFLQVPQKFWFDTQVEYSMMFTHKSR